MSKVDTLNKYQKNIVKRCSVVFIVNFEGIFCLVLMFLLLTLNIEMTYGNIVTEF